jgi:structural maintenance of chromosome 1
MWAPRASAWNLAPSLRSRYLILFFIIGQGDVESIAAKNPRELSTLFEQISGSEDFKTEYEELKQKKEAAEENTIHNFQKRKGYAAERKQVKQ